MIPILERSSHSRDEKRLKFYPFPSKSEYVEVGVPRNFVPVGIHCYVASVADCWKNQKRKKEHKNRNPNNIQDRPVENL